MKKLNKLIATDHIKNKINSEKNRSSFCCVDYSLRDALEGNEDAYYNLFGEFPNDNDW